jgi:photosystem II stability/assembly factor-like uncharacterized protein
MKKTFIFMLSLLFVVLFEPCSAQTWEETNGPYGGNIRCIANNDTTLFVGTGLGIFGVGTFRSEDNGENWSKVDGLTTLNALVSSGSYLLASTEAGVKRSEDNGETWSLTNYTGTYLPVCFLSDGNKIFCGGGSGLYISTDNGLNWTAHNANFEGLTPPYVPSIGAIVACAPYIYIGTNSKGIFRSSDGGETWLKVNGGLGTPAQINSKTFNNLVVLGTDIFGSTSSKGVFRLLDNGTTWTEVNSGLTGGAKYVSSLLIKDTYIYCCGSEGLWRSNNTGTISWTQINSVDRFTKLFLNGSEVLAGMGSKGIYKSTDDCSTWTSSTYGINGLSTRKIIKGNGLEILAATYEGSIYRTIDQGANWEIASNFNSSTDALFLNGTTLFANGGCSEYRSTDNGATWEMLSECYACPYTHYLKGDTIFAGGSSELGAYYSTDNGDTWNGTSGIISLAPSGGWTTVLSFTSKGLDMYAGTTWGAFKSADNGLTWTSCYPALTKDIPVSCVAANDNYIFAGTSNYWEDPGIPTSLGIFRSGDNGSSWVPVNNGLGNLDVRTLVFNGTDLYAGTLGGIFKSTDNGNNWTQFNEGFTTLPKVNSLYFEGDYVYADNWTVPTSIYRRAISGSVPEQPSEIVGSATPCIGSIQTYSVINEPGVVYTWDVPQDWSILSGQNTNSISVIIGTFNGYVQVIPSNVWGNGAAQTLTVYPVAYIEAGITITSDQSNICGGSQVTITAIPNEGGETPAYQWFVNGIENTETGPELTYIPSNNDNIYVQMTSSLPCVSNNPVQSNTLQLQVTEPVDVIVSITVDKNNVCAGDLMTFTATTTNGGDQPQFNWFVDENNLGENASTFSYIPENGDIISLVFTSSEWCVTQNPVTSNAIVAIVNALPVVSWNYTDPTTVCIEDWGPITLTGGLPEGGIYSGDGVNGNIFNQAVAGVGNHIILYSYTDANNCPAQAQIEFTVDACLGITESANGLLVYPNPASDNVTIKMNNQNIVDVILYNSMGIAVYGNHQVKATNITVPVQNLQAGNYTLKVTTDYETIVRPVIIK